MVLPAPLVCCCLCFAGLPAAILQISGSKAQVAACLLDVFALKAATAMPARLLQVVALERGFKQARYLAWDGPNAVDVHNRVNTALSQLARAGQQPWPSLAYSFQVREGCRPGRPSVAGQNTELSCIKVGLHSPS